MHENDNCVNRCTDADCYEEVYGEEPVRAARRAALAPVCTALHALPQLEAGEIDPTRFRAFTGCITRNVRQRKRLERAARKAGGAGGAVEA